VQTITFAPWFYLQLGGLIMAKFKSKPLSMITFGRVVVKFDKKGFYSTKDEDKIKAIKEFTEAEEVK
tara:strand:- start:243 stop:443 length:201 start_codon:yes stop_codon:yes gene_type:complete